MQPLALKLGQALAGRYAVEGELGRGGMATVFLARDLRHDRMVALKLLPPEVASAVTAERFLREIRITARLQHPGILGLFDSGADNGLCWYVMPHVEGQTLRQRLECEGRLPLDEAVRIGIALAGALDYAHQRGVIHRDLKPENILFSAGQPILTDFGLARALAEGQRTITVAGLSLGTPPYMSPEQAMGLETIDHRSDLYGLGCVLFEMVAGRPPFIGSSFVEIVRQHQSAPPPSVRTYLPEAPLALDRIFRRVLAKDPAQRYQSAGELASDLEQVRAAPSSGPAAEPSNHPTAQPPNRRAVFLVGAVILIVLLAVVLLVI